MTDAERHADRLLRCYPRVWRDRYGDELAALLADDIADRPLSWRRDLDVVRAGLRARLAACGLAGGPLESRSAAAVVAAFAAVVFVASALSIWTQLADGWLTVRPDTVAVAISLTALSTWLCGLLVVSAAFALLLAASVVRAFRSGYAGQLRRPLATMGVSVAVLVAGIGLTATRWPGARLAHHGGVLAHAARIGWAATETISTFWSHPARLLTLPSGEVAWMVLCPAAVMGFAWSAVRLVRVTGLRAPRAPALGGLAVLPCFLAAAAWVLGSQHAPNANYRAGTLDLALLALMAVAAGVARLTSLTRRESAAMRSH